MDFGGMPTGIRHHKNYGARETLHTRMDATDVGRIHSLPVAVSGLFSASCLWLCWLVYFEAGKYCLHSFCTEHMQISAGKNCEAL